MTGGLVDEVLAEYGALTRGAMARYLPAPRPGDYLSGPVADYPARGGKMLRPALCIAAARCFGAQAEEALGAAAGIELLHNALLIHDDIEDGSETRRGLPALHVRHGLAVALNAGDALALLSLRPIVDAVPRLGSSVSLALLAELDRMAQETAEGQAMELGWRQENRADLAPEDYLVLVLKKTCWLATIYPCRVGALLGLRRPLARDAFLRFGFFLGAAFQIHDDVLNIEGDARYGKETCGDLREGKRTLMLIDLLSRLRGAERARALALLAAPRADQADQDVAWLRLRMVEEGTLERARLAARALAGAALHEFTLAFGSCPPSRDRDFLAALAPWTLARVA